MLDFPASPTTGQAYGQWLWDGVKWTQGNVTASTWPYTDTGRSYIHNGMFVVAQRGNGPWTTTAAYTADRWRLQFTNDTNSVSVISLADADRTAIGDESAQSALQDAFTGSGTVGSFTIIGQRIENVRRLANKSVAISFWAKATSGTPPLYVRLLQHFGTGGSPSAAVFTNVGPTANLSTTWTRYSMTATLPSVAGATLGSNGDNFTELEIMPSLQGVLPPTSGTVQLWGIQLEIGSVATPLAKRDPADELALCRRFFIQNGSVADYAFNSWTAGGWTTFTYPLGQMRATPTVLYNTGAGMNVGSASVMHVSGQEWQLQIVSTAGGGTSLTITNWSASADL